MNRPRFLWLLLLLIPTVAAVPATSPADGAKTPRSLAEIKLTYRQGQGVAEEEQILRTLGFLAGRAYPADMFPTWSLRREAGRRYVDGFGDSFFRIGVTDNSPSAATVTWRAGTDRTYALLEPATTALKSAVAAVRSIPDEQVQKHLDEAEQELAEVRQLQQQLDHLSLSRHKVQSEILTDKLKALELEKLRLEMDLAAKKARGQALREQMKKIASSAATRTAQGDAVIEHLQKVVDLQAHKLERHRQMYKSGALTSSELAQAEQELLEAKAKVAVREQELSQPTDLDLLARLTQEVTLVAVDQAELAERLQQVIQRLPPDDLSQVTQQDLSRVMNAYSASTPDAKRIPLAIELQKRQKDLELRMLALRLADVQVIPAPATQPK